MMRYLNYLLLLLSVSLIVVSAWFGWQLLDRPITHIRFTNVLSEGEQAALEQVIRGQGAGTVLSLDIDEMRERLSASGWTRSISVRRVWPDTLEISLAKQDPIAKWGDGEYLTSVGSIVRLPDPPADLPLIEATLSDPDEALKVLRLVDRMAGALKISAVQQNLQGEWRVRFDAGFDLFLGREQLGDRVERFSRLHRWAQSQDRLIHYVDARYSSGVAVRFRGPEEAAFENALAAEYRTDKAAPDGAAVEGASAHGGR